MRDCFFGKRANYGWTKFVNYTTYPIEVVVEQSPGGINEDRLNPPIPPAHRDEEGNWVPGEYQPGNEGLVNLRIGYIVYANMSESWNFNTPADKQNLRKDNFKQVLRIKHVSECCNRVVSIRRSDDGIWSLETRIGGAN